MSSDHRSLFIGNLSPFVGENHLIGLFSHYGPVQMIRIIRDKTTKESLCYGFVEFGSPEEAENIRIRLDGVEFYGQNLKLSYSKRMKASDGPAIIADESKAIPSLQFSYISYQLENIVTPDLCKSVYSKFGPVEDLIIKKHHVDEGLNTQSGYGFVTFANGMDTQQCLQHTFDAVEGLFDNVSVNQVLFSTRISKAFEYYLRTAPSAAGLPSPPPHTLSAAAAAASISSSSSIASSPVKNYMSIAKSSSSDSLYGGGYIDNNSNRDNRDGRDLSGSLDM